LLFSQRREDRKMEMTKEEQWNPIKQDVKKGVLRYVLPFALLIYAVSSNIILLFGTTGSFRKLGKILELSLQILALEVKILYSDLINR
jgi:hypothetical protein